MTEIFEVYQERLENAICDRFAVEGSPCQEALTKKLNTSIYDLLVAQGNSDYVSETEALARIEHQARLLRLAKGVSAL
jgi:hypothetical protein